MSDTMGLLGELVYITMKVVADADTRRELYDHMADAFVDVDDEVDFFSCKGVDPVYDQMVTERFEEVEESDVEELDFDDE